MASIVGLCRLANSRWLVTENGALAMLATPESEKALSTKAYKTIESPWAVEGLEGLGKLPALVVSERYTLKKGELESIRILPTLGDTATHTVFLHHELPGDTESMGLVGVYNTKYLLMVEKYFSIRCGAWVMLNNPGARNFPCPYAVYQGPYEGIVAVVAGVFVPKGLADDRGHILSAPYSILQTVGRG